MATLEHDPTMTIAPCIPVISSLRDVGSRYRAWLVDIWGVMHNGCGGFPNAAHATSAFRKEGGVVVLLSNSPRTSAGIQEQLCQLGVPNEAYDATVTSGDLTRETLSARKSVRALHIGPERDRPIFEGLDINLVDPENAELVICTNLYDDETETPDDYRIMLRSLAARRIPMVCANPDHKVERGGDLVYCAGALAAVYEMEGGGVLYAGKPHAPVYDRALNTIGGLVGFAVDKKDILAIGDGINTDIAGPAAFGIDAVFVASGVHVPRDGRQTFEGPHLAKLFADVRRPPLAIMETLTW
jgi:HAD superfamily hydrolase (TIGR01459 family)